MATFNHEQRGKDLLWQPVTAIQLQQRLHHMTYSSQARPNVGSGLPQACSLPYKQVAQRANHMERAWSGLLPSTLMALVSACKLSLHWGSLGSGD